jgi:hypothetical protein
MENNITVCVRIRPKVNSTSQDDYVWKVENNNILNFKSKEIFAYGKKNKK